LSNTEVTTLNPVVVEWEGGEAVGLLERARSGDAEAFCELCRGHESGLLRQAVALSGNLTIAEDLAQDTLVEAWKSLRRYNGRCRFFTWLCAILLNRYRNELRMRRPVRCPPSLAAADGGMDQVPGEVTWPDQEAEWQEQAALVREWVEALPPKHQQVVHLRFYVDESLAGIAAALGCSMGTVKSRLFHALNKLRGMKDVGRFRRDHFPNLERTIS